LHTWKIIFTSWNYSIRGRKDSAFTRIAQLFTAKLDLDEN
jgi:hypothetical protein